MKKESKNKVLFIIDKETGEYGFYGSLPVLIEKYPFLKLDTVKYSLMRLRRPYKDNRVTIYKGELIRGGKSSKSEIKEE